MIGDCPGGGCTCNPDESGTCLLPNATTVGGAMVLASAEWTGGDSVDVVFK